MKRIVSAVSICLLLCATFLNLRMPVYAAEKARVMISSYNISGDDVSPGKEFDLNLKVKNTSSSQRANSILISGDSSSETVYPIYGQSNQIYIDSLEPNEEREVTMHMAASAALEILNVDYKVSIEYASDTEAGVKNDLILQIPIGQKSALVVPAYSVADSTTVGAKTRISVKYKNVGLEELNDVIMHVNVDGMTEQKSEIGSVAAGEENNKETYFSFAKSGQQNVTIFLSYKNSDGTECFTQNVTAKVQVAVADGLALDPTASLNQQKENQIQIQPWQFVLIFAIIVLAVIVAVLLQKDKNK